MPPVQNNQPGTGFGSRGKSVGLGPSVTPLGWLSAPRMNARGAIWAHIQILLIGDVEVSDVQMTRVLASTLASIGLKQHGTLSS